MSHDVGLPAKLSNFLVRGPMGRGFPQGFPAAGTRGVRLTRKQRCPEAIRGQPDRVALVAHDERFVAVATDTNAQEPLAAMLAKADVVHKSPGLAMGAYPRTARETLGRPYRRGRRPAPSVVLGQGFKVGTEKR